MKTEKMHSNKLAKAKGGEFQQPQRDTKTCFLWQAMLSFIL